MWKPLMFNYRLKKKYLLFLLELIWRESCDQDREEDTLGGR